MFVVNLPYFPEWFFASGDKKMIENAFCGKGSNQKSNINFVSVRIEYAFSDQFLKKMT